MSQQPTVTVIIPTYNHAHFLREALHSLCTQTFTNWEAIVVNNYSQDDTIAVVESFSDSRIQIENFRNDGIIAASRNRGIALARGKYLAFLDSDDTWYPEKLARCLALFEGDVGLVAHGLHWFGERERDMYCGPEESATFDALLFQGSCITPSATVVLKNLVESVGGFSENPIIITAEDYHFSIKLAQKGVRMRFPREILGTYRIHAGNQSSSVMRHLTAVLTVIEEFIPGKNSLDWHTRMRRNRRCCLAYYGAGRAMQHNEQFADSLSLLWRAIKYWPFFPKSYIATVIGIVGKARSWMK